MAQAGFTPIQLYYSSTTTNVPLAANLASGELAINITDGKLFYKDNANAVQVIGWKIVPATAGGTGQTSYAVGDLLYADTTTTLAKLADVATGNALISGGVGVAPSWGKIGLTTHVSGTLPTANGGTNLTSFTANGVMYASSTSALATGSVLTFDGTTLTNNGNTVLGDAGTDTVLMNAAPSIGGAGYGMGMGFRNRIINGAMAVSQYNGTSSVTVTNAADFFVTDRFKFYRDVGGTLTGQQSTTAPAGFATSLFLTATTGASPSAAQLNFFQQAIEGLNVADLGWGTASAQTITLSFWVRSSVTGTYSISLSNSALNRAYVATYAISVADTWEQKTITIAGDTSGTWLATNGVGLRLYFDLGSGSNYNLTANAWGGTFGTRTSGSVSWFATTGATFYITGVQIEKGSTATAFDYRPYGTELALCESYFQKTTIAGRRSGGFWIPENLASSNSMRGTYQYPVTMRAAPTGTITQDYLDGGYAGKSYTFDDGIGSGLSKDAAVLFTDAYFVGGGGNYGSFVLTIALTAEL
jgi:hypothetical protein